MSLWIVCMGLVSGIFFRVVDKIALVFKILQVLIVAGNMSDVTIVLDYLEVLNSILVT